MSTPPFIAMPDGVGAFGPPDWPAPALLAEPAAGEAVLGSALLVPGFTGSKEDFLAVLAPLAALGWRVAAVDLPGQGGFPGLGPRGSHTPATLGAAVRAVLDPMSPDEPVHLVGHSMGGLVTREVLLEVPDRLASWTPVCSGPAALPQPLWPPLVELRSALGAVPMELIWAMKEARDRAAGWNPGTQDVADFVARRFVSNDPDSLADFADLLMTAEDRTTEVSSLLAAIGLPTAVVTGELDDTWPPSVQEEMAAHLGVPWHLLAGVGHSPAAEDPRMTVAVLHDIWSLAEEHRVDG